MIKPPTPAQRRIQAIHAANEFLMAAEGYDRTYSDKQQGSITSPATPIHATILQEKANKLKKVLCKKYGVTLREIAEALDSFNINHTK